jgi:outer membrane protein OmpA-like peptidoglycan-associated protein
VTTVGQGSNDPIASNSTAEGRERNRRVEFLIDAEAAN